MMNTNNKNNKVNNNIHYINLSEHRWGHPRSRQRRSARNRQRAPAQAVYLPRCLFAPHVAEPREPASP